MTNEIYCVWYSKGFNSVDRSLVDAIDFRFESSQNHKNECEKNYDLCVSNKILLAVFKSEEEAEKFRSLLSAEFNKNSFVGIETIN